MDADDQTQILRDIADNLSIWKKAGPKGPEKSEYVRKAAIKSKKLLWENVKLLHYCGQTYKFKSSQAELSLGKLNWDVYGGNLTLEDFTKQIGEYDYRDYAHDDLINECKQWANKIETGTERKWTQPMGFTKWSKVFGVHVNTIRRWFKSQPPKIKCKQVSPRRWCVKLDELPQDVLERVKAGQIKKELNSI